MTFFPGGIGGSASEVSDFVSNASGQSLGVFNISDGIYELYVIRLDDVTSYKQGVSLTLQFNNGGAIQDYYRQLISASGGMILEVNSGEVDIAFLEDSSNYRLVAKNIYKDYL